MNGNAVRVVIDTSVLTHYLIRPGTAIRRIIEDLWINENLVMVFSPELIQELNDVLGRDDLRRYIHPEDMEALLDSIQEMAEFLLLGKLGRCK
jgi:putative PIN family toxin of toxin-antitoxin system